MPRQVSFDSLSRDDLLTAVRDLVARRRITADEVRSAADRATKIASLEAELARLRGEGVRRGPGRPRGMARPARVAVAEPPVKAKRRITNTPKRQAALRRQGRFLVALKKLNDRNGARVKAVAKKDGVPAPFQLSDFVQESLCKLMEGLFQVGADWDEGVHAA